MKKFFEEGSIELAEIHELLDKLYKSTNCSHNPVARSLGCADSDFGYTVYLLRAHVKALEEAVSLYDE